MTVAGAVAPIGSLRAARQLVPGLLLLLAAFAIRSPQFGNPVIHVDDQFYLLVADRMLHDGALPYIDIWDRKPLGLFLLYGAIRLLGGDGIVEYQVVATLFAAATAFVLSRIATRIASEAGAWLAGIAYLLYLGVFGGDGGQSPVFYNLFTALAVWCVIRTAERPRFDGGALLYGLAAMALMGAGMQVKYTALFEGAFLGLALLWLAHRAGVRAGTLVALAVCFSAVALLPTLAGWGWYASAGHSDEFVYANFLSIFERNKAPAMMTLSRLIGMAALLAPLGIAAWLGMWRDHAPTGGCASAGSPVRTIIAGWAIASVAGVLIFGDYFDHYALPMLAPFAVAAAPMLGDRRVGVAVVTRRATLLVPAAAFVMAFAAGLTIHNHQRNRGIRGSGADQRALAAFIRPRLDAMGGCLFVFEGEPILYHMTGSCLPTRWAFPDHLTNTREVRSLGVPQVVELRRIMATRPPLIVSTFAPDPKLYRPAWDTMQRMLVRDYRIVMAIPIGRRVRIVYQRLPGH